MAAPARKAVLLLSHLLTEMVRARYRTLRATLHPQFDVVLLLTAPVPDTSGIADVVLLGEDEIFLPEYGAKSASRHILPGNTELPVLAFFRRRPWYQAVWLVEYDVWLPCGGETLRRIDEASAADLIMAHDIAKRERSPNWYWWRSFAPPDWAEAWLAEGKTGYSLFIVSRFGPRLLAALERAYRNGWSGHHEATVTSIALEQELLVEHLNQVAMRALGHRVVRDETFHVHHCAPMDGSTFYHPVKDLEMEEALRAAMDAGEVTPRPPGESPRLARENQENPAMDRFPIPSTLGRAELEFFREHLQPGMAYGEFGVGGSTVLAALAPVRRMVAVDSDPLWLRRVAGHLAVRRGVEEGFVTLLQGDIGMVREQGYPVTPPADGAAYFDAPWTRWSEMPEMVFLDGRYRLGCAIASLRFARSHGAARGMKLFVSNHDPTHKTARVLSRLLMLADVRGTLAMYRDDGRASDEEMSVLLAAYAGDAR